MTQITVNRIWGTVFQNQGGFFWKSKFNLAKKILAHFSKIDNLGILWNSGLCNFKSPLKKLWTFSEHEKLTLRKVLLASKIKSIFWAGFNVILTGGSGIIYTWSLGDGTNDVNTTTPYITHAYTSPGQYNISIIATNGVDRKGNFSLVTVEDPVTSVGVNSSAGTAGENSEIQIGVAEGSDVRYKTDIFVFLSVFHSVGHVSTF